MGDDQNDTLRIVIALVAVAIIAVAIYVSKQRAVTLGDDPGDGAATVAPPVVGGAHDAAHHAAYDRDAPYDDRAHDPSAAPYDQQRYDQQQPGPAYDDRAGRPGGDPGYEGPETTRRFEPPR